MSNDPDPEDLSVQEWLYQISYQLEQQNQLLRERLDGGQRPAEQLYECDFCGNLISESSRERHMETSHALPQGTSYEERYREV